MGYGAYLPRYRLPAREVSRIWHGGQSHLPIVEKAVAGQDEDTVTMSIEAARNALARARIDPQAIGAVWVGSESHPYAVKPTSTIVAEAIGAGPSVLAADWEFACKAGTEAMQAAIALVGAGMARYALAVGMDTAQGRPGDALEYTAASGGAAYIIGPGEESLAILEGSCSFVSDTPDFWRRPLQRYPQHAGRFTGQPAYFHHSIGAARDLMQGLGLIPKDFYAAVFHQPNLRFPVHLARELGFSRKQIEAGLLVESIGNTYAGSSMIGLSAVLDVASPGQRVLQVSFGSGAGSDAFCWTITDRIEMSRGLPALPVLAGCPGTGCPGAPTTRDYMSRRREIDYATYVRYRGELHMH